MLIYQTLIFKKALKKLPPLQKIELDKAIQSIAKNPLLGDQKKGDLMGIRVFKFKMDHQNILIAYEYKEDTLTLLAFGSHENFYRDLKR